MEIFCYRKEFRGKFFEQVELKFQNRNKTENEQYNEST